MGGEGWNGRLTSSVHVESIYLRQIGFDTGLGPLIYT